MAKGRYKVKFDHINRKATMSLVDEDDNVLIDHNGQLLTGIVHPYGNLELYPELYEKIEDNGKFGVYYFPKDV